MTIKITKELLTVLSKGVPRDCIRCDTEITNKNYGGNGYCQRCASTYGCLETVSIPHNLHTDQKHGHYYTLGD